MLPGKSRDILMILTTLGPHGPGPIFLQTRPIKAAMMCRTGRSHRSRYHVYGLQVAAPKGWVSRRLR